VTADVLIKNGLVVDGSGKEGERRDVAIKGDRIILPEPGTEIEAKEVVDAQGLVVAPGFIDIHSHTTLNSLVKSQGGSKLSQGITTEITGNCGAFPAPFTRDSEEMELSVRDIDWSLPGYRNYLEQFANTPISHNLGYLIGHGSIRAAVMGYADRKPTAAELEKMKELVAEGMKHGAMGMSTGLGYSPGIFAQLDELVELYKVVAQSRGSRANIFATAPSPSWPAAMISMVPAILTALLFQRNAPAPRATARPTRITLPGAARGRNQGIMILTAVMTKARGQEMVNNQRPAWRIINLVP